MTALPPSASVSIRQASLQSAEARALIAALDRETLALYPGVDPVVHFRLDEHEVGPGRGAFLVAYVDDEPRGCGAVRLLDADTAELKRMFVVATVRRQGLGRRLLAALEDEASRLGARRVGLETGTLQPQAIALYASCGYSRIDTFATYPWHPQSVFMEKALR